MSETGTHSGKLKTEIKANVKKGYEQFRQATTIRRY